MGKSSAMRRVIKTSTTQLYIIHARARDKTILKKMKKELLLLFSGAPLNSLSLKSSKSSSRVRLISLCDDDDDDDEMRDYVETFERIFF